MTAGSSLTLPWNIYSWRTHGDGGTLKIQGQYFCDTQSDTEIHKNNVSQKSGAIGTQLG